MTWNDIKKQLDTLSPDQLNEEAVFMTQDREQSGLITSAYVVKETLYNTGESDPCELRTRKELKQEGYSASDIRYFDVAFEKGSFIIELSDLLF